MSRHKKAQTIIDAAKEVLEAHHPITVRQIYYQLVAAQIVKNTKAEYQAVGRALVAARKEGLIPWSWITDRLRQPRHVAMWSGLASFAETAKRAYRRDVWALQSGYVECWLEKDAMSGIVADVLNGYGVTLNVGRGHDGWASIHNAAERYGDGSGVAVLYFCDFDPSGEDMIRSLRERLGFFGCVPEMIKCALVAGDVDTYDLPPAFTKRTDTRRAGFIAKHGDVPVELDALPVSVLQSRLRKAVEARMDLKALARVRRSERADRAKLGKRLA